MFVTVVHTYFYIVVDTQRGCHNLKLRILSFEEGSSRSHYVEETLDLSSDRIVNEWMNFCVTIK